MSNERPEFPPIESAPPRHTWVWALAGAALVVGLIRIARRAPDPSPARPALAAIADAKPAAPAETAKPAPATKATSISAAPRTSRARIES